jgi:hypothetical protein
VKVKHSLEQINNALKGSGLPVINEEQVTFLGEGAWHDAYIAHLGKEEKFVIRFPKKKSVYGTEVEYDERKIHADYAGTKKYYELANKVKRGICPSFYTYHVKEGNTYTVESYMGKTIDLKSLSLKGAFNLGFEMGELFSGMHILTHDIEGFGYLDWNGEKLVGLLQTDVSQSMKEENEEYVSDYEELCRWDNRFKEEGLKEKLLACVENRTINNNSVVFTNQDCSPENLMYNHSQLSVIDPFPILYDGNSMAGNFMNCYEAIFPTYYNTKRYERHDFDLYINELKEIANGYLEGYSGGDKAIKLAVRKEQFIKLADLCFSHYKLITTELPKSTEIGVGTKQAMEERLNIFLEMLKDIKIK